MRLEDLETFIAIVEGGSLREASRRLNVSKSVVSDRLSALEMRVGGSLVVRTTRALSLTDVGQAFYERAVRIVYDLHDALDIAANSQKELRGPIRIAAPMTFGLRFLMPALHSFFQEHSSLRPVVELDDRMVDIVGSRFDAAVRIGRLADSSLVANRLTTSLRMVVASPDYWSRHGRPKQVEDLETHRSISYVNIRPYEEWRFEQDGKTRSIKVACALQLNDGEAIRDAAIAGLGVAVLPTFVIGDALQNGLLETVDLGCWPTPGPVQIVYPPENRNAPKVRALIKHLQAAFSDPPAWDQQAF